MEVLTAQFCTIAIFFCSMLASCLLPLKLVPGRGSAFEGTGYNLVVSLMNCLSAGVFLATFFVGLLPEVRQEFQVILNEKRIITEFPVTEFVVFWGFFLAVFVEQLLVTCKSRLEDTKWSDAKQQFTTLPASPSTCAESLSGAKSEHEVAQRSMYSRPPSDSTDGTSHLLLTPETSSATSPQIPHPPQHEERGNGYHSNDSEARHHHHDDQLEKHVHHHHQHHPHHHAHHHHSHDLNSAINPDSGVRVGMLLLSLGVHSVFEGMTLGLQTHLRELFNLFIGVLIHECLVAFAIGVSIAKMNLRFVLTLQLAVLFSVSLPIGQVIGIIIGNNQSLTNATVIAVLQAIAAGTFIQVTFLEVIPEGLADEDKKLLKIFFLVLGFAIIAAIPAFADVHDHKRDISQEEFRYLLTLKQNLTKW